MSRADEYAKLVDSIYRSLLDKFNPCAKQIITAGKSYLKAMQGAASASNTYIETISKLAKSSQEGVWGGSADIGGALSQLVSIQKEVQSLHMNVLKAFYVDLIVPLETNLEKDTKAVNVEQKKFIQQHKLHNEAVNKATSTVKKQRKKLKNNRSSLAEKEYRNIQLLEDEKTRLDDFSEKSLKQAIKQERRRYGFVLERQCSLAKHCLMYHDKANGLFQEHLTIWEDVSKTREILPSHVAAMFPDESVENNYMAPRLSKSVTERNFSSVLNNNNANDDDDDDEDDPDSFMNSMRRTHSFGNLNKEINEDTRSIVTTSSTLRRNRNPEGSISRAKSEVNLNISHTNLSSGVSRTRPKSMMVPNDEKIVRAVYSYLSSGDNQLSFHEGDMILLIGGRNKGWQFGENLRNNRNGWFPVAYTEDYTEEDDALGLESSRIKKLDKDVSSSTDSKVPSYVLPIRRSCTTSFITPKKTPLKSSESHYLPLSSFNSNSSKVVDVDKTRNSFPDGVGCPAEWVPRARTSLAGTKIHDDYFSKQHTNPATASTKPKSAEKLEIKEKSSAHDSKAASTAAPSRWQDRIESVKSEEAKNKKDYAMLRPHRRSMTAPLPIGIPTSPLSTKYLRRKNSDSNDSGIGTISSNKFEAIKSVDC